MPSDQEIITQYKAIQKRKIEEEIESEAFDEVINSKEFIDQVNLLIDKKRKERGFEMTENN